MVSNVCNIDKREIFPIFGLLRARDVSIRCRSDLSLFTELSPVKAYS